MYVMFKIKKGFLPLYKKLAEEGGFEPPLQVAPYYSFSKAAPSTAWVLLQIFLYKYTIMWTFVSFFVINNLRRITWIVQFIEKLLLLLHL